MRCIASSTPPSGRRFLRLRLSRQSRSPCAARPDDPWPPRARRKAKPGCPAASWFTVAPVPPWVFQRPRFTADFFVPPNRHGAQIFLSLLFVLRQQLLRNRLLVRFQGKFHFLYAGSFFFRADERSNAKLFYIEWRVYPAAASRCEPHASGRAVETFGVMAAGAPALPAKHRRDAVVQPLCVMRVKSDRS